MALEPGSSLGAYQIVGPLGAGGMGEVYRALDPRLDREVAIKVLPEGLGEDEERLGRFEREAKVLANLNHPNVATLHGYETDGATTFLVMELVEGLTLAERISAAPLPVEEAIPLFLQIAEGLEAAHEQGVVHRDLKPANIKLTEETPGVPARVKILDFGLAKALQPEALSGSGTTGSLAAAESPTLTYMATMRGEILGTAAYMSPEQARGKAVDRRTDIWAFGCCLYEALTGQTAFQGETPTDIIAQVVTQDPDWNALPDQLPEPIRRLMKRCIERDPRRRLRDIGEAWIELDDVGSGRSSASPAGGGTTSGAPGTSSGRGSGLLTGLAVLAAFVLGGIVALQFFSSEESDAPVDRPTRRYSIELPPGTAVPVYEVSALIAISRDGSQLALSTSPSGTDTQLSIRQLDGTENRLLPENPWAYQPFFSPDGKRIGYQNAIARELRIAPVGGGTPIKVADSYPPVGATWLEDDTIVFTNAEEPKPPRLFRIPSGGGDPTRFLSDPRIQVEMMPAALPGDRGVLFSGGSDSDPSNGTLGLTSIWVKPLPEGEPRKLVDNALSPSYAPSGHLLFVREGSVWATAFDLPSLEVVGPEAEVQPGVESGSNAPATYAVSAAGVLIYGPESSVEDSRLLTLLDPEGDESTLPFPPGRYGRARLSPDGKRAAIVIAGGPSATSADLWIFHIDGSPPQRLTNLGRLTDHIWSRDGREISFIVDSRPGEILTLPADGSGTEPAALEIPGGRIRPRAWSPDGQELIVQTTRSRNGNIVAIAPDDPSRFRDIVADEFLNVDPTLSRDAKWMAYGSNRTGAFEIYVRPYPGGGPPLRVSPDGGEQPRWAPDGTILYYVKGTSIMVVDFESGPTPSVGQARAAFTRDHPIGVYDVGPDGRILLVSRSGGATRTSDRLLIAVEGFFDHLRRVAPRGD